MKCVRVHVRGGGEFIYNGGGLEEKVRVGGQFCTIKAGKPLHLCKQF